MDSTVQAVGTGRVTGVVAYRPDMRVRAYIDACNSDIEIDARVAHMSDGQPYDVLDIGTVSIFMDRVQTKRLHGALEAVLAPSKEPAV